MPSAFLKLPRSGVQIATLAFGIGVSLSLTAVALSQRRAVSNVELFPVQGQLLVAGQLATGAEICFYELRDDASTHPVARATPRADGSFEVYSGLTQRGARPGQYAVTVAWRAPVISGEDYLPGRNVVPSRYASPETTPLKVQVHPQDNRLPPWSLPACDCGG